MVKKPDLKTWTKSVGSGFYGYFILPGMSPGRAVQRGGKAHRFDSKADAAQAASDTLCHILRDPTLGWIDNNANNAKAAAEALFKGAENAT